MTLQTDESQFLTEARAIPRGILATDNVAHDLPDAPLAMPEQELAPARSRFGWGWSAGLRVRRMVRT